MVLSDLYWIEEASTLALEGVQLTWVPQLFLVPGHFIYKTVLHLGLNSDKFFLRHQQVGMYGETSATPI